MPSDAGRDAPDLERTESSTTDADAPVVDSPQPAAAEEGEGADGQVDVDALAEERDRFRDMAMRNQAELENFRKAQMKRQTELLERASQGLVERLLPVLDNFDLARAHDSTDTLDQLWGSLWGVLEAEGVSRIDGVGDPFDPNLHEAVQHEPGDDDQAGPVVASIMRPGYEMKGRVVRAAMVSVKG